MTVPIIICNEVGGVLCPTWVRISSFLFWECKHYSWMLSCGPNVHSVVKLHK